MVFFLLFSAPLAAAAAGLLLADRVDPESNAHPDLSYIVMRYGVVPAIFLFVPFYLVVIVVQWALTYDYSPGGLYWYHLVVDYLLWGGMASGAAIWVARRSIAESRRDRYLTFIAFFGTVFTLLAAATLVMHDGFWTAHQLVFVPTIRVGMIILFPLVLARPGGSDPDRWVGLAIPVYIGIAGVVSMWYEWLRPAVATGFLLGLVLLTGGLVYWIVFVRSRVTSPTG